MNKSLKAQFENITWKFGGGVFVIRVDHVFL